MGLEMHSAYFKHFSFATNVLNQEFSTNEWWTGKFIKGNISTQNLSVSCHFEKEYIDK